MAAKLATVVSVVSTKQRTGLQSAVFVLACGFVFAIPWAQSIVVPGLGTFTRIIGLALTGVWLASVLIEDRLRTFGVFHRVAYVWVAWNGLALFWSPEPLDGFIRLTQYFQLFVFAVVIWNMRIKRADVAWILQSYVFGCWVTFAFLLNNVLSGNVTQWQARATIENANENEVGLILALGLSAAWYLASGKSSTQMSYSRFRLMNYLYIGAGFLGIMFTASRGGFLSIAPFLFYLLSTTRRLSARRKLFSAAMLSGVIVGANVWVPDSAWERIGTIPAQLQARDIGARFDIWSDGIPLFLTDVASVLFGQGPASFTTLVGKAAHNIWLSVVVETGMVGLILFVSMAAVATMSAFRLATAERNLWLSLFGTFWLSSFALSLEYHKVTWTLFAIVVAQAGELRGPDSDADVPPANADELPLAGAGR